MKDDIDRELDKLIAEERFIQGMTRLWQECVSSEADEDRTVPIEERLQMAYQVQFQLGSDLHAARAERDRYKAQMRVQRRMLLISCAALAVTAVLWALAEVGRGR